MDRHPLLYLFQPESSSGYIDGWMFPGGCQSRVSRGGAADAEHGNMTVTYVKLKGLKNGKLYRDEKNGSVYPADALMEIGLPLPMKLGEYRAYQMLLIME